MHLSSYYTLHIAWNISNASALSPHCISSTWFDGRKMTVPRSNTMSPAVACPLITMRIEALSRGMRAYSVVPEGT